MTMRGTSHFLPDEAENNSLRVDANRVSLVLDLQYACLLELGARLDVNELRHTQTRTSLDMETRHPGGSC